MSSRQARGSVGGKATMPPKCSMPKGREAVDRRWQVIIRHYIENFRPRVEAETRYFRGFSSLGDAVEKAAMALDERGKRFGHQTRIPKASLDVARRRLLSSLDSIKRTRSFDDLLGFITIRLEDVHRLGELYFYDTAARIGAKLGLAPHVVYLHRGTRVGAKNLGLDGKRKSVALAELPAPLRGLPPNHVEDILCIYKDRLPK